MFAPHVVSRSHTGNGNGEAEGVQPKMVIWAHNSHVGDARASAQGQEGREWNLGQMVRQSFDAANVFILGLGTYEGTVTAAKSGASR